MILHNIKIAFRNLLKYKLQNVISILSIAIGIVAISAVHSFLSNVHEPRICNEPYFDRTFKVTIFGENKNFNIKDLQGLETMEGEALSEIGYTFGNGQMVIKHNGQQYKTKKYPDAIKPNLLNFFAIRSVITGDRIATLKDNDAVISQKFAKKIFGDENPIGATIEYFEKEFTIVDVCENSTFYNKTPRVGDVMMTEKYLHYSWDDEIETSIAYLVMKEGVEYETFAHEIASRLGRPRSEVWVDQICNNGQTDYISLTSVLYIIGYMILLASIIGFLRMQIQLFWMRKREIALRVINGAKKHQIFLTLITETAITIILSSVLAVIFGIMLSNSAFVAKAESEFELEILNKLEFYSAIVCGGLIAACGTIIYIVLIKICNSNSGLSAVMRKSNSHIFRNIMLGIQTFICMVLISLSSVIIYSGLQQDYSNQIPKEDRGYHDAISIKNHFNNELYDEISKQPELKSSFKVLNTGVGEADLGLDTAGQRNTWTQLYYLSDVAQLDFLTIDGKYQRQDFADNNCCILSEKFREKCESQGLLADGTISVKHTQRFWDEEGNEREHSEIQTLKVSGTYKSIAYQYYVPQIIVVGELPDFVGRGQEWILISQPGQRDQLMDAIQSCIERVEPGLSDEIALPYTQNIEEQVNFVHSTLTGLWILGLTCLILCISGIYSTAALDTRARRKEMAIRKINGAKAKDIAMLFVKSYIWILIPAVLLSSLLTIAIIVEEDINAPYSLFFIGIGISLICIIATLAYHIRQIMQVNPSEIIAKE
ncbi:MAG: ABC transporter permease [Bacteroidales bacterium]|nr:ABC transporter permease [Bacteroidales bacterium]